ncbi:hypothetical protein [Chitinophaga arvensicola]|uniref:Uncharacterized protein n=1 Tax=Chitinophaga arvensicola TaxID=29529 RepID=A0A1I0RHG9_9BACT|nr:hypothetical protein [Chitinophaga arvensicola]SEW40328.1 hypothetical protein SAMN04488122_2845 [Chitinophaga arvensicola]
MFDIKIQSPFTFTPVAHPGCSNEKALALYHEINWADLYRQMEASGSSPDSPFYYFEINRRNHLGEAERLCISGYIRDLVCVGYMRPKMERKGFFKKKDVLNPTFRTQMDAVEGAFAFSCLDAFMKGNNVFLEENLYDKEGD